MSRRGSMLARGLTSARAAKGLMPMRRHTPGVAVILTSVALPLVMAPAALAVVPYAAPTPVSTDPGTQSSPVVSGGWDQRVT